MFRAINAHLQEDTLSTCSIWYCHSLREFMVTSGYTAVYRLATINSRSQWQYHMLNVYNVFSWRWAFTARNM